MKCYIVRIYRRDEKVPEHCVGTVEFVDQQEVRPFKMARELTELLFPAGGGAKGKRRPIKPKKEAGCD